MHAPFISAPAPTSSSNFFTEPDMPDMHYMAEQHNPQNYEENSFEANFSEEEIHSKDSKMASFANFPNSIRSISHLERPIDVSMHNTTPSNGLKRPLTANHSDWKLRNALNKIYYKKVRTLLGEQLEGEDRVTLLNLEGWGMEDASPKTLYEQEKEKPPIGCDLFYIKKKDPYEQSWVYRDDFPFLRFRLFLLRIRL